MNSFVLLLIALAQLATTEHASAIAASSVSVTAMFNGTATIPCNAPESVTSKHGLEKNWQKKTSSGPEVVLVTFNGRQDPQHQMPKYRNRAREDPKNLTLYLDQITVMDEGTFECIVKHKPGEHKEKLHHSEIQLNVLANFRSPEVTKDAEEKVKNGTTVTLTCSSNEGYPAPQGVVWNVSWTNGSTEINGDVQTNQDKSTSLYNLTSTYTWNFTRNVNVTCTIHQTAPLGPVSSRTISIDLEEDSMKRRHHTITVVIFAVFIFVGIVTPVAYVLRTRNPRWCFPCGGNATGGQTHDANQRQSTDDEDMALTQIASQNQ